MPQPCPIMSATEWTSGTILVMDIGYARVSTAKQDLDRQIDALCQEGIASKYIYVDKKSGSTTNRPGLHKALDQAREGDIIVVHTLDRSDAPQAVAACTRLQNNVLGSYYAGHGKDSPSFRTTLSATNRFPLRSIRC